MKGSIDRRALLGAAAWTGSAGTALAKVSLHWPHHKTSAATPATAAGPVVETRCGKLAGVADGGVSIFRGVPYAASTAGANRFRPPQPMTPWKGLRAAFASGSISPQPIMKVLAEEDDSQAHEPQGEDCLLVNVWSPALGPAAKAPVMVWFHGGGYTVGGGSAPWYDGQRLAARHGVVVVTVNHRLNVFGFLDLSDIGGPAFAGSGNAGMLDCVAALEWVRDNISSFGGDPGNVTIFGESGGAGKVSTLMAMPAAKGLFHKAVAQSGAALRHPTQDQSRRSAKALMAKLNLGPGDIAKLQALPTADIIAALTSMGPMGFGPSVDGAAIPSNPWDPGAPMVSADVPFLTGSNLTETTFLPTTPLEPMSDSELLDQVKGYTRTGEEEAGKLVALYRDQHPNRDNTFLFQLLSSEVWMRSSVLLQAERKAMLGAAPVYVYQFNRLSPARDGKLHCPHGSEIPYAFDNLDKARAIAGDGPQAQVLADKMSAVWVQFARGGVPYAGDLPHWPAYTPGERAVMVFDEECAVVLDPDGRGRAAIARIKAGQA